MNRNNALVMIRYNENIDISYRIVSS